MMYQTLAPYYDALVMDEEALQEWLTFVKTYVSNGSLLELACGSGEVAIALAKIHYHVEASDISEDMLSVAKEKKDAQHVAWQLQDMRDFSNSKQYDGILCFCDSMNYLLQEEEFISVLQASYAHLHQGGVFLFDVHTPDRLVEFAQEYVEDGVVKDMQYQWSITSEDDYIYQVFAFYDKAAKAQAEVHKQRVYQGEWIFEQAQKCGFQVEVFTDFHQKGIQKGEKYFFACRKEGAE